MAEPIDFLKFVDLKRTVEGTGIKPDTAALMPQTPLATPAAPAERGDDLIARAVRMSEPSDEEMETSRQFQGSWELIKQRAVDSEEFAKTVFPKLQTLEGENFFQGVIDEADRIKIEFLKKEDPTRFNSGAAATTSFLNGATFGQLTRIQGGLGQLIGDRPYEEIVTEQAERARLLQKAFPTSTIVGDAASYLIPGSPARILFNRVARIGGAAAKPLISKVLADPKMLEKISAKLAAKQGLTGAEKATQVAANTVSSSASAAAGAGAVGAVKGFLGEGMDEAFSLERTGEAALVEGVAGGAMGALIPLGFGAGGEAIRRATPALRSGARSASNLVARTAGQISGVEPSVLRASRRSPEAMKAAAGTESEIGEELVDFLQSEFAQLPEVQAAKKLLPQMGRIDARPLLKTLREIRKTIDPGQDAQVKALDQWASRIESMMTKKNVTDGVNLGGRTVTDGTVSAQQMWEIKETLQSSSKVAFGESQGLLGTRLKFASRQARTALESQAKSQALTSEYGKTYAELMGRAAQKRKVLSYVGTKLGKNVETQSERSEAFIINLFGKNKSFMQSRVAQLDSLYGTDFLGRSRMAAMARQAGPDGALSLLPQQTTGRSLLGTVTGAGLGSVMGPAGAAAGATMGALASSPRLAARIVGTSDAISGFVRRLVANPQALERVAGRLEKAAAGKGRRTAPAADKAAKQLAVVRVPQEIRALAREVQTALTKDGPLSAASTVRVIADTPYFVGLVHFFEIQDREERLAEARRAIEGAGRDAGIAVKK